ncbi:restriction endonuclease subunit S [Corynebacterium striatum]|uniref:restriction endonuclease subunit S n=1 Tax=Corynebacterium striatum TaxID=43770 RepID=UPI001951EF48|nr:restriction endonuclease subunit S [Corynebacterium striatum]QRP18919.1 restriction endonuclease subunit S [Corynebacterium striatum]
MSKHNTPALRFDGFDGEWSDTTLEQLFEYGGSGGTPSKSRSEFYGGGIPFLGIADIKDRVITHTEKTITELGLKSSAAWEIPEGAISLAMYASVGRVGIAGMELATSQAFYNMVFADEATRNFVFARLAKMELMSEWEAQISTGTQRNLNAFKVRTFPIKTPFSLEEQSAIGELFSDLDALIEQHRAKHGNLQQTKTALMQRMFPQDGSNEPELRLGGFSGAWESRIMRDCAEYSKGNGYSKKDIADEGTPVIHYGRLYTNYETAITGVDTFASPQPGALISRGDEVLVPASGETAEDIAIASALLQSGVLIGGDLNVIRPRQNIDPVFLALSLSDGMAKETLVKRAQGKSVVHLRNSDIQEVEILFPSLEEQRAISDVFTNLDALITAESRYITQLAQAKSALLQRMFV